MNYKDINLGDTVYFFGDVDQYTEAFFWVKVESIKVSERLKHNLINDRYNMDACFSTPEEAIASKREWLDHLERTLPDCMNEAQ